MADDSDNLDTPELSTERLRLRPLRPSDAAEMFAYRSDPEVARYQGWQPASLDQVSSFIEERLEAPFGVDGEWCQLAITLADGSLIGDCGLHFLKEGPGQMELGITLARHAQGHGYATETIRALLRLLFEGLGKHRVIARIDPRNGPSVALFTRVGMRREAHHVESYWFRGEWADDVVFAMLRREFHHVRGQ